MKECPQCHTRYDDSKSFCSNDGCRLVSMSSPDNADTPHNMEYEPDAPRGNIAKVMALKISAIVLLILLISLTVWFLFFKNTRFMLDKTSIQACGEGDTIKVMVDTNSPEDKWKATCDAKWIHITKKKDALEVYVKANDINAEGDKERSAVIKVECEGLPDQNINVRQPMGKYIDLGLSVKWATCNLGAKTPSESGYYIARGELREKPNYEADNYDDKYNYEASDRIKDISGDPKHDAARATLGAPYRIPTGKEMNELLENCTQKWITRDNIKGLLLTGPNGSSIFLPAASFKVDKIICDIGSCLYQTSDSYPIYLAEKGTAGSDPFYYFAGNTIRPVADFNDGSWPGETPRSERTRADMRNKSFTPTKGKFVDLGLSVKWASANVGADSPEKYGDYFAWGDVNARTSFMQSEYMPQKEYSFNGEYDLPQNISGDSRYDIARANMGSSARMPTKDEVEELFENCSFAVISYKGIDGFILVGKNKNSIFLPFAGTYNEECFEPCEPEGVQGLYWTASSYDSENASVFSIYSSMTHCIFYTYFYYGHSVRAVCDK